MRGCTRSREMEIPQAVGVVSSPSIDRICDDSDAIRMIDVAVCFVVNHKEVLIDNVAAQQVACYLLFHLRM